MAWEDEDDDDELDPEGPDPAEMSDEPAELTCPYCKRKISEDAEQCPFCGNYIVEADAPRHRQWWWITALVLLILLLFIYLLRK